MLLVVETWVEWVGDLGWPPCVKSQVLAFGRATRPTLIESFFVVRRGEDFQVGTSALQLLSLKHRCGEQGAPLGPRAWDQLLCLQLPAAGLRRVYSPAVRPCCANFMRGQQKEKRVFASSYVKKCGCEITHLRQRETLGNVFSSTSVGRSLIDDDEDE